MLGHKRHEWLSVRVLAGKKLLRHRGDLTLTVMTLHIWWWFFVLQYVILPAFTQRGFGLDAFTSEFGRYRHAFLFLLVGRIHGGFLGYLIGVWWCKINFEVFGWCFRSERLFPTLTALRILFLLFLLNIYNVISILVFIIIVVFIVSLEVKSCWYGWGWCLQIGSTRVRHRGI